MGLASWRESDCCGIDYNEVKVEKCMVKVEGFIEILEWSHYYRKFI
jgi:hypothetical protein